MKTVSFLAMMVFITANAVADETVTTTDGRTVLLKSDGTYQIQQANKQKWQDYLSLGTPLFRIGERDYSHVIDYMPTFKNLSTKTIIGIEFVTDFKNVFGKSVQKLNGTMEERIPPGKSSQSRLFYVFKDNQFIDDEVYDKLLPLVSERTGSQEVTVNCIVFEGGEVVKF